MQAINKFKQQISWADETRIASFPTKDRHLQLLVTDLAVYIPTNWRAAINNSNEKLVWEIVQTYCVTPILLVYGDPRQPKEIEKIWRTALNMSQTINGKKVSLGVKFIDAYARLQESRLIRGSLEGMNWNRTIVGLVEEGENAQPIWEWD